MFVGKIFAFLFLTSACYAGDIQTTFDIGSGVINSRRSHSLDLGVQQDIWGALKQKGIVGGWIDSTGGGRSSSALISGQLGFEVNHSDFIGGVFSGPAILLAPDVLLGGWFQIMSDAHLGFQDKNSNYFGIIYRHVSSCGIESPNLGRDFVGLEIKF